ncbi:Uncharacterized conserved protein YbjQ, UPF0145 family [Apibacter mensalis]|uniref:UPF0145 protein Ga0061079_10179 n=1 Tax=Apibacter mensalis TaxID=1586267 RepID=A0A0X3AMB7_9FLAO|nr:heavy metal-binding domain-containing protein [Apibacter mensalis]CVK15267.1 Uncharacterized conserved protein YbjQ, UPF0145 family [Apibacter mensalis]
MILTTTNSFEGLTVKEYKGIVTGETIIGANFIKDFKANLTDFFGGRFNAYEKVLVEARQIVLKEPEENAVQLGANAVFGIHIDYETLGAKGSMLMVSICGTVVII